MKIIDELLEDQCSSHILPFLWLKGEEHAVIGQEIEKIYECGIREICLEARPHPDFAGPGWWKDMDFIMEEAKKREMKLWLLDDAHFPTGYANGGYKKHPELKKLYLAERHVDILGPCQDHAVLIDPLLGADGVLEAVLACPKPDGETLDISGEGVLDLTEQYRDGFVYFDLPDGPFRLFVLFTTRLGGGREHYMNLIDTQSVRVLIDEVYEPHYQRYQKEFGETFMGFFSDEPEFGNVPGYPFDACLGRANARLPWSGELKERLLALWGTQYRENLPALWYGMGSKTGRVRCQYMDEVTKLVYICFSGQLKTWCEKHGVEYIGHIIEDDNAHARLGCSIGHYFREMKGQHMAGIDVVHHEIMPGFTNRIHQWAAGDGDGEFFHFGLAKLGSSCAHTDPVKKNRALCEIFGNYGWGAGVSLMKWLTNHMLVRGINVFTPHAFAMQYPERDCPPHFYAQGNNPQYPAFVWLMRYMNRACHLLSGGIHIAEAAVLYHAEAEWSGERMLFQKPVRQLMEHQMDCDVIPADLFDEPYVSVEQGRLVIHEETYGCLILPYCQYLVRNAAEFVTAAAKQGLPVFVTDKLPEADTCGQALPEGFEAAVQVVPLSELSEAVARCASPQISCTPNDPGLRFFGMRQNNTLVYMFFNENTNRSVETKVCFALSSCQTIQRYDPWNNVAKGAALHDETLDLSLFPGEAAFYILEEARVFEKAEQEICGSMELDIDWHVTKAPAGRPDVFEEERILRAGEPLPNLNGQGGNSGFSGIYRYCGNHEFSKQEGIKYQLLLPEVGDTAEVVLNGRSLGQLAGFPARVDVTEALINGKNEWVIDVATTLVWERKDGVSAFMQLAPTGIRQKPVLEWRKER